MNWRKLQDETQDLDTRFNLPYIFKTPVGLDVQLKVFKKDSSYLELHQKIGVQYLLKGGNYLMFFFDNSSNSLINAKRFANSTVLPSFADVRFRQYGIQLRYDRLDYRPNPQRGFSIRFTGTAGTKVIQINPELPIELYTDITLRSPQYKLESNLAQYIPLGNRGTALVQNKSGYLLNDNLFFNELFRIGGINNLRGFDVESISSSFYSIFTAEYRFLLEQNSNLFAFVDYAYYEREVPSFVADRPMGIGAGIRFQTKPGIFSLTYALGSQQGSPFLVRSSKIHFGFVNYF